MIGSIILALLGIIACAACAQIPARICDERELCAPEGRLPTTIPPVGPRMAGLMEDIITSAAAKHKRGVEQEGQSLVQRGLIPNYACCPKEYLCLLLDKHRIPLCYDERNTDYMLPDGSAGNVISGKYQAFNGDLANLISGNYTLHDGTSGNIYDPVPEPTAKGVPLAKVKRLHTCVRTIQGTTIHPTFVRPVTEPAIFIEEKVVYPAVTRPGYTVGGTTIPPYTITAAMSGCDKFPWVYIAEDH